MKGIKRGSYKYTVTIYKQYLDLYKFYNNGSLEGATSFEKFYWMHTYHYNSNQDHDRIG